jgi:hypothetical protein
MACGPGFILSTFRKYSASSRAAPTIPFAMFARQLRGAKISPQLTPLGLTGEGRLLWETQISDGRYSLHVSYCQLIPAIQVSIHRPVVHATARMTNGSVAKIEILPAGEGGPRRLDTTTVMNMRGIPFLTISEFIRAKLKIWAMCVNELSVTFPSLLIFSAFASRGEARDAHDITYALSRHWNRVDINRIPEQDMNAFVVRYPVAAPAWTAIKSKYNM